MASRVVKSPTLGGAQLWTDVRYRQGWRVQRRAARDLGGAIAAGTGVTYRLVSPKHVRHHQGTRAECEAALDGLCPPKPSDPRELVVMLHGLGRTARSMGRLSRLLRDAGFATAPLDYASTQDDVSAHAAAIDDVLEGMTTHPRVSFVSQSLGGIVARAVLARRSAWQERMPPHRVVMLAPPSQGASLASRLDSAPFRVLFGPAGRRMSAASAGATQMPPPPHVPFGIIAGSLRDGRGVNPLIDGPDDGVVAVDETRLEGAVEHRTLPVLHTVIMQDARVMDMTLRFLETGSFGEPS